MIIRSLPAYFEFQAARSTSSIRRLCQWTGLPEGEASLLNELLDGNIEHIEIPEVRVKFAKFNYVTF